MARGRDAYARGRDEEDVQSVSFWEHGVSPKDSQCFQFHITVVREAILEMTKALRTPAAQLVATSAAGEELEGDNKGLPYPPSQALLLHTETGQPYTTSNVRYAAIRAAHVPGARFSYAIGN
jgi:hypothetical protein